MKKGIIAILAMLTVFAMVMVSCGGGSSSSSSGGGGNTKITFDLNYKDATDADAGTFKDVKVNAGTALGNKYPGAPTRPDGALPYQFIEWNSEPEGTGNWINGNTKFARDTTVYAIWVTFNSTTQSKVTFNYNHNAAFPASIVRVVTTGNTVASFPTDPGRANFVFRGWFTDLGDTTNQKRFTANTLVTADVNVDVRWIAVGTKPTLLDDEVRFEYDNGTDWQDIVFESGVTTWAQVTAQLKRDKDVYRDQTKAFANWKDSSSTDWTTGGDTVDASTTYTAKWWDGVFGGTATGAEKVYLENSNYVVYEFTLTENVDLTKVEGLKATYGLSEAGYEIYKTNGRPWRAMGPYFFNGTADPIVQVDGSITRNFYGDFMLDDSGTTLAARFNSAGGQQLATFNKFHPYMVISNGAWDNIDGADGKGSSSVTPAKDTWFTTTYKFDVTNEDGTTASGSGSYTYAKTLRLLGGTGYITSGTAADNTVLNNGKAGTVQILPENTTTTKKVYFALGLTRANAGESKGKNATQNPWEQGLIQLIKDVKLLYNGSEIDGVIPNLTAGSAAATKQVFAGYVDPINFGWRGAATDPVVIKADPNYAPPLNISPALASYTIKNPTIKLYQSDAGKTGTEGAARKRITIAGQVITFDLGEDDYNDGEGLFSGGGFKIVFADIDLPEDYRAYKSIVLETTVVGAEEGSMVGKQIIISSINGSDVASVVNNTADAARYVPVQDGDNVFTFGTGAITMKAGDEIGLALRANNWSASNVPFKGTLTVKRITFKL